MLLVTCSLLRLLVFLFCILLPAGWAKHWIVPNSLVNGVLVDYLMPDVWIQDLFAIMIIIAKVQSSKFKVQKVFPRLRLLITDYLLPARNGLLAWRAWPITLVLISVLLSPIPLISAVNFARFLLAVSAAWIIYKNKNLRRPALIGLAVGVIWTSLLAVGQLISQETLIGWQFMGEPIFTSGSGGVKKIFLFGRQLVAPMAAFPHANVMGAFGLLFYLLMSEDKHPAYAYKLLKISKYLSFILILLSFSLPVWFLTLFILVKRQIKSSIVALIWTLLVFLLLATSYQLPAGNALFAWRAWPATSFYRRWSLLKHSLTIIKNNPFFGVGWGGFVRKLPPSTFMQPVHNVFLLVLAELGIVGVSGLVLVIRDFLKKINLIPNYLLLITIYLLLFSLDHYFWTTTQGIYMLWVMIALL